MATPTHSASHNPSAQPQPQPQSLPTTRAFLTRLFQSLPAHSPDQSTANPLKALTGNAKNIFMTLHVLYPNELLPALDLLDRRLVTRMVARKPVGETTNKDGTVSSNDAAFTMGGDDVGAGGATTGPRLEDTSNAHTVERPAVQQRQRHYLYFVRSSQTADASSRYAYSSRTYDPLATHYEVRLAGWNCSCPAFAFAAFPVEHDHHDHQDINNDNDAKNDNNELRGLEDVYIREGYDEGRMDIGIGGLSRSDMGTPMCKHLLACLLLEYCGMLRDFVDEREVSIEELAGWAGGWGG